MHSELALCRNAWNVKKKSIGRDLLLVGKNELGVVKKEHNPRFHSATADFPSKKNCCFFVQVPLSCGIPGSTYKVLQKFRNR